MNIKTDIISGTEAQDKILTGAKKVHDPVSSSLGPSGRNVAISYVNEQNNRMNVILCDGVTIAASIALDDEYENVGASFIKEAARKTVDEVGDGTTVSVILSYAIHKEINKLVAAGHDPMLLRKGIEKATEQMIDEIKKLSIPVKTLEQKQQIARVSAKDDELGDLVAECIHDIGAEGLVVIDESTSPVTKVEKQKGFQFDKGWAAQEFMTDPRRGLATLENPYILITDEFVKDIEPIRDLLNDLAGKSQKLVFIAGSFGLEVAGLMVDNKNKVFNGRPLLPNLLIEAPSFGQNQKNIMQDIAILTGGKFFSRSTGLDIKDATIDDLGRCGFVKSTKTETIIAEPTATKEDIKARIDEIKKSIETEDLEYDKDKIKERLARFTSGVSVIRVGGATEAEMKERKERVKDSVAAVKAAVKKGIVPGGEVIYLTVREKLDQKDIAQNILYKAFYEPFRILLTNAGMNDGEWYEKLKSQSKTMGVNVAKQTIVDMIKDGVIDPSSVSVEALKNASSMAILNSSVGYEIIQKDIDKK